MELINAIGRRKSAVARVYLSEGTGKIIINKVELEKYFPSAILQYVVKQPLSVLGVEGKYDIKVNLDGGGFTGQSQALRLAIARALVKVNADDKKALKDKGFLTRDSRAVERKKPGQPKARRHFQFSKRSYSVRRCLLLVLPRHTDTSINTECCLVSKPEGLANGAYVKNTCASLSITLWLVLIGELKKKVNKFKN